MCHRRRAAVISACRAACLPDEHVVMDPLDSQDTMSTCQRWLSCSSLRRCVTTCLLDINDVGTGRGGSGGQPARTRTKVSPTVANSNAATYARKADLVRAAYGLLCLALLAFNQVGSEGPGLRLMWRQYSAFWRLGAGCCFAAAGTIHGTLVAAGNNSSVLKLWAHSIMGLLKSASASRACMFWWSSPDS
jgi:hypothetical protein